MNQIALIQANRIVQALLDSGLSTSQPHDCPYLPNRIARSKGFRVAEPMDGAIYQALMDQGFRRSGDIFYKPACPECDACIQYRVLVNKFSPSRSKRRNWRINGDIRLEIGTGQSSDAKHALFCRYLDYQHDGTMSDDRGSFDRFLYDAPVPGVEFCYYLGRKLVGVSLADRCPTALSSVYMYFDPDYASRGLGTHSILREIEYCREIKVPYYYLGYYVCGSRKMAYKAHFRPGEILTAAGRWTRFQP